MIGLRGLFLFLWLLSLRHIFAAQDTGLMIESGVPPLVPTKYELVHRISNFHFRLVIPAEATGKIVL